MSSHHFVKEGQEPALLILDAPAFDVVAPLLEWAPLVVVAACALDDVLLWNIKIDVVLGEETHVKELTNNLAGQAPITILTHASNEPPLIKALHFLIRKKQNAVNICSASAIDALRSTQQFARNIQINALDGNVKWSSIATGRFEKWMAAGTILFLQESVSQQPIVVSNLKKVDGHFECLADGMVALESKSFFWLGEPAF